MKSFFVVSLTVLTLVERSAGATPTNWIANADLTNASHRLTRPLPLAGAMDIALQQNSAIRKSHADLEATYGVVVQTRAIALPKLGIAGGYAATEESAVDRFRVKSDNPAFNISRLIDFADQRWSADVRVTQSIYEGGRINSALRTAKLAREQALLNHETIIADVLRDVRVTYYDVLAVQQQIIVRETSLKLLEQELTETRNRFEAGTVPKFNVLRAEVEVANARPKLIRARNALRIVKDNFANLLGENVPRETEELSLQLIDKLDADPFEAPLSTALSRALERRTELAALRKAEALRQESIVTAKAGYKPSVQIFGGYGARSSQFSTDLTDELHGWEAGAQLSWSIFDGWLTKGRVQEAKALHKKMNEELTDAERKVELEVRTAYSSFIEAQEVLRSQEKVQELADEALRLASARAAAGTATQLDVLNAQTALTEARTTQVLAQRDYAVAKAKLERAMGPSISKEVPFK